ncbi:MAG: 4-phosphopantoate--beta-alanine ligase [Thermoplasmata archaeon]
MKIPKSHPRYRSLTTREKLVEACGEGILAIQGLIAHGRGESFDYLLGERTIPPADIAEEAAAAVLLNSERPVLSVNGNVAVLAGEEVVALARAVPCPVEVNVFHRTEGRLSKIVDHMRQFSDIHILGENANATIPGLDQPRGLCEQDGIFTADTVLVALEDGDRTEALVEMGKTVIAIDLNPLCRTSRMASVTVVDEVMRAIPRITDHVKTLKTDGNGIQSIIDAFDNRKNLKNAIQHICESLQKLGI